tara:strand:+ start:1235 stop:1600 length:366 start_codon:yes stop_codon:yes gene_type:complete
MIFKITTVTSSADTAVVTTLDMRDFYTLQNSATTLTCTYASGNVVAGKDVTFVCEGTDAAEKQLNVNRLQTWFSNLMAGCDKAGVPHQRVYVMNLESIIGDAGLTYTGAATKPLTTTTVAV